MSGLFHTPASAGNVVHTPIKRGQRLQGFPPELITSELIETARNDIDKLEQHLVSVHLDTLVLLCFFEYLYIHVLVKTTVTLSISFINFHEA